MSKATEALLSDLLVGVERGKPGWDRIAMGKCINALRHNYTLDTQVDLSKLSQTDWFIMFTRNLLDGVEG